MELEEKFNSKTKSFKEEGLIINKPFKGTYVSQISENNALPYQAKINNKQIRLIAFALFASMIYVKRLELIQVAILVSHDVSSPFFVRYSQYI